MGMDNNYIKAAKFRVYKGLKMVYYMTYVYFENVGILTHCSQFWAQAVFLQLKKIFVCDSP